MSDHALFSVIAERVAEVVNRKLRPIAERVDALERRLRLLETEVTALRRSEIETIIQSFLKVKTEEHANTVAAALAERIEKDIARLESLVAETHAKLSDAIAALTDAQNNNVTVDLKPVEAAIGRLEAAIHRVEAATKQLSQAVSDLNAKINSLAETVSKLESRVSRMETEIRDTKGKVDEIIAMERRRLEQLRSVLEEDVDEEGSEE